MTSIDVVGILDDALRENNWGEDGLLHASTDLVGSLRHSQLRLAGAPEKSEDLVSLVRLRTGTMWHEYLGDMLGRKGVPVMREVPADPGLPEGWAGTADLLVWDKRYNAFVLFDLKTTKGEGIQYILRDGAKQEHIWQVSSYWHSFVNQGYPMLDQVGVIYLPMNQVYGGEPVEPCIQWVTPLPQSFVWAEMERRWERTRSYLYSVKNLRNSGIMATPEDCLVTSKLEPVQPRVQKLFRSKEKWELKLVPHWSAQFCPYEPPLCDCSEQGVTKIGEFLTNGFQWDYVPRSGYELTTPELVPA